jgi:hypothetical protein
MSLTAGITSPKRTHYNLEEQTCHTGLLLACIMHVAEKRKLNSRFAFSIRSAEDYLQQAEEHRGNCQGLEVSVHSQGTFLGRRQKR